MPKVSVIIPIYNVASYVERCLHSLFSQTLEEIEFIFVNDATPDKSIEILKDVLNLYPHRKSQVKLINHLKNLGVAAARTSGIKASTGEYIIHCDPDDYVELDMYEKLYNKAKQEDADIVMCNHIKWHNNKKVYNSNLIEFKYPQDYLIKWCECDCNFSSLCDKLINRSLIIKNEIFPLLNLDLGEDLICVVRAFYHAKKIVVLSSPLYNYIYRENSLTNLKLSDKIVKMKIELAKKINELLPEEKFDVLCNYFKFTIKMGLRNYFKNDTEYWFNLFLESHKDILRFKSNSTKSRILWKVILSNFYIFYLTRKLMPNKV